ncbi:MAG: GNAT family N-acetyltransferase, partial [Bacteroidota bacterium]
QSEKWGLWKILLSITGDCIGYTGFWYFFDEHQPELLYALLPQYAGKGYASEAAKRMVTYAFEELQYDYVSASLDQPNTKSVGVCEKIGMQLVGEKIVDGKPTLFYKIFKPSRT